MGGCSWVGARERAFSAQVMASGKLPSWAWAAARKIERSLRHIESQGRILLASFHGKGLGWQSVGLAFAIELQAGFMFVPAVLGRE